MKDLKVLAIIPARGGSKGIPKKNIASLCGKPLIAYSIETALKNEVINRVIVSTDDEDIATVSKLFGAEVPFLRPRDISGDQASPVDAVNHVLATLKNSGYVPDIFIILFPTHPFRPKAMIDMLINKLINGHRAVITVKQFYKFPSQYFEKNNNHKLTPLIHPNENNTRQVQLYSRTYGSLIGYNPKGDKEIYIYSLKNPVILIDIDTMDDLLVAERVIKQNLFNF